jgi:hypothetical protein
MVARAGSRLGNHSAGIDLERRGDAFDGNMTASMSMFHVQFVIHIEGSDRDCSSA